MSQETNERIAAQVAALPLISTLSPTPPARAPMSHQYVPVGKEIRRGQPLEFPKVQLKSIKKLMDSIIGITSRRGLLNKTLTGADIEKFVDILMLTVPATERDPLWRSVSDLINQTLTPELLAFRAEHLAANLPELQHGRVAYVQRTVAEPTWAFAQIQEMEMVPADEKREARIRLTARVMWGPLCCRVLHRSVPANSLGLTKLNSMSYVAGMRILKAGKVAPRNVFRLYEGAPRELVQMYLWVQVESREWNGTRSLVFTQYRADDHIRNLNRSKIRQRRDKCVRGLMVPCSTCHFGIDQCHVACRAKTKVEGDGMSESISGQNQVTDGGHVG